METIIQEHLYDCAAGFPFFDKEKYQTITDLGSGGGFPGLLLGIAFPDKQIHLVEKSVKKTLYLQEAKTHLKLKNIHVHSILADQFTEKTDLFTARAFKSTKEILDATHTYFYNGVEYLLFKGRLSTIQEEISIAQKKYKIHYQTEKIAERIPEKERHLLQIKFQSSKTE